MAPAELTRRIKNLIQDAEDAGLESVDIIIVIEGVLDDYRDIDT